MKKLSLLLLFVAAFFVVSVSGCRKPAEEPIDDPVTGGGGGGTPTAQTGVIKVTVVNGPANYKAGAEVTMTGDRDSMLLGKYANLQVTNGSGVATFAGLKLNKTYYFHAEYTENSKYFEGDTSAMVKVSNQPYNATIDFTK